MIRREWRDPNYSWQGLSEGRKKSGFTHAVSLEALRERLARRGLTDVEIAPYSFRDWLDEAEREKEGMLLSGPPESFKESRWKALKDHLFDLFAGKCAYCETLPRPGSHGDVEHFRPKRHPQDDPGHPGYYWLAYEPRNLLPCCEACNRAPGKARRFPISGVRAAAPGDELDGELPLLVHPIEDDPAEHFEFVDTGAVAARSPRGKESLQVYGLNREHLREARLGAIADVASDVGMLIIRADRGDTAELVMAIRGKFMDEPYSAAKLSELDRAIDRFARAWRAGSTG